MPEVNELTLGLRFARSQARVLRNIAEDLRSRRPQGIDIGLYDKAAESAQQGVPLIVRCTERQEVERMAHAFETLGVKRPAIDELTAPGG